MINIRRNVFETNSSSMHSLVVTKKVIPYTKKELRLEYDEKYDKGKFKLWKYFYNSSDMEYERSPFRVLHTPLEKLRYYSAYMLGGYHSRPSKAKVDNIKKFIMKQTGITDPENIKLYREREEYNYGENAKKFKVVKDYGAVYSNDSGEDPMHYVEKNKISMEDLILNPKYTIIVDGDETQDFKSLFDAGIITAENLEDISSGKDYWDEVDVYRNIYWINRDKKKEDLLEDLEDDINEYKKYITIGVEYNQADPKDLDDEEYSTELHLLNKTNLKKIKILINEARKLNPKLKSRLYIYTFNRKVKLTNDIFKNLDTSLFDILEVENKLDD